VPVDAVQFYTLLNDRKYVQPVKNCTTYPKVSLLMQVGQNIEGELEPANPCSLGKQTVKLLI